MKNQLAEKQLANFVAEWLRKWKEIAPDGTLSKDNILGSLPKILSQTKEYYALSEKYVASEFLSSSEEIHCKKGCSSCCHHYPETIESFELLLLYSELRQRDDFLDIIQGCLAKCQAYQKIKETYNTDDLNEKQKEDTEDLVLNEYFALRQACPMLGKQGECTVHKVRPNTCRMFLSFSPEEYCVPEHLTTSKNKNFLAYFPDEIEEGIYELGEFLAELGLSDSMYEGILQLNFMENELFWDKIVETELP